MARRFDLKTGNKEDGGGGGGVFLVLAETKTVLARLR